MRDIPDYFWEWTELDFDHHTGKRLVKANVPPEILKKLIKDESDEFNLTWRRCIINVDLETGKIIPVEEAVKRYNEFEKEKIEIIHKQMQNEK